MGSPISPIVANLFMEDLEVKALSTAPTPPTLWRRFVDDTFIIIQRTSKESSIQDLNSIDDNIHFTCEEPNEDGSIAFLDMLITPDENGRLNTSDWAINRVKLRSLSTHQKKKRGNNNQPGSSTISGPKPYIVVPYHQGLSESYKNICKQYGIDVHLKGGQTIKDHLMSPKDKDPINKKVGSYTGLSVTGLIVMMNILVSQLEILMRG